MQALEAENAELKRRECQRDARLEALELRNARLEASVRALLAMAAAPPQGLPLGPLGAWQPQPQPPCLPPPSEPMAAAVTTLGLDGLDRELLLGICGFLPPSELARLACVSQLFGRRSADVDVDDGGAGAGTAQLAIVEEAARRYLAARTDRERCWVPRCGQESWLGLVWEVELLRRGAMFRRAHAHIMHAV